MKKIEFIETIDSKCSCDSGYFIPVSASVSLRSNPYDKDEYFSFIDIKNKIIYRNGVKVNLDLKKFNYITYLEIDNECYFLTEHGFFKYKGKRTIWYSRFLDLLKKVGLKK